MASTYTTGFSLEKIGSGEQAGTWGTTSNHNWDIVDRLASYKAVAITTNADTHTLTVREASPESGTENLQDGMYRAIKFTGALDSNCTVTIAPNTTPAWFIIENATTDSGSGGPYSVVLSQGSGANVTVQNGKNVIVYCDGAGAGAAVTNALVDLQVGTLTASTDTAAGDDAAMGWTASEGLILTGQGSTSDVTIKNDADSPVLTIATGTTSVDIVGSLTASTLNPDSDTSAGAAAQLGYTASEGLILTGQGSTSDVTIKNDADSPVLTIATGTTSIDIVGSLTASTLNPDSDVSAGAAAQLGYTAAEGLILTGQGSTNDVTIKNDADADVITIATGGTSVDIVGDVTAATVKADGDTSAGDDAAMGWTAASGLILTGEGTTNDITIRNDTNSAVLEIATGQSDVEVSAGNLFFGTASKGVYLGVTSATATNLLDDYEEGTWTAALEGSTTNPDSSVTVSGTYTKIGRLVYVTANFGGVTTTGASGGVRVTGLPFTPSASQATGNVALHTIGTFTNTNITPYFTTTPYVAFYTSPSAAAWAEVMHNAGASRYLYFSGTYIV